MASSVLNGIFGLFPGLAGLSIGALLVGVLYFVLKKALGTAITVTVKEFLGQGSEESSEGTEGGERSGVDSESSTFDRKTFERLTDAHFEERQVDPENCWRRAFTFTEIAEEYAVDRKRRDGDQQSVTEELMTSLKDGEHRVVLGTPGAGKSTICKQVAWRWHDDGETGSVLYWRKEKNGVLADFETLEEQIETAREDGPVLVAVEDAARRGRESVYEAINAKANANDVSFLLDSREQEWHDSGEGVAEHLNVDPTRDYGTQLLGARESLDPYHVPKLDEEAIRRIVAHFEDKAERNVEPSAKELHDRIQAEAGTSPMLLLMHSLLVGSGAGRYEGDLSSPLETHVADVFDAIRDADDFSAETPDDADLLYEAGLLVNVLNAAGIEIRRELVHALADDELDHEKIETFLDELEGKLLFDTVGGTRYLSNHEEWSMLYLDRHLAENDEDAARETFETCVNAVLSVTESESFPSRVSKTVKARVPKLEAGYSKVRDRIRAHVGFETPYLDEVEGDKSGYADEFLKDLFDIGTRRPKFAQLFGTTDESGIDVPDDCSDSTEADCSLWRFRMYRKRGEVLDGELDLYEEKAAEAGIDSKRIDAVQYSEKGKTALRRGNYGEAREYHEQSLTIRRDLGDTQGEATSLDNLGLVARHEGDYEAAREYHQQSLDIERDLGNKQGEANSLGNLGLVAQAEGDYEAAREYHQQSLTIKRDLGDTQGEATSLNNLGVVAEAEGDYEAAREYHQQSLAIMRDLGDTQGEATNLGNLGLVARHEGDYEAAREYHQQSLAIERDLGNKKGEANSLNNLGLVAQAEGDYEAAREYHQQSLAIMRDLGNQQGEATNLGNLGLVARHEGDYEAAREYHQQSLAIFREIGAVWKALKSARNLAIASEAADNPNATIQACETGLEIVADADISGVDERREWFENKREELEDAAQASN